MAPGHTLQEGAGSFAPPPPPSPTLPFSLPVIYLVVWSEEQLLLPVPELRALSMSWKDTGVLWDLSPGPDPHLGALLAGRGPKPLAPDLQLP